MADPFQDLLVAGGQALRRRRDGAADEGVPLVCVRVLDGDAGVPVGQQAGGDGEVAGDDADLVRHRAAGISLHLADDLLRRSPFDRFEAREFTQSWS
ncbi:hypothetical protein [Streptomyces sp. NBC_00280]|uniref:hypothetical protein n=1 Tax=Streptomyces sp. NBC_00280 TaxID=2975699 RepID=UPI00352D6B31